MSEHAPEEVPIPFVYRYNLPEAAQRIFQSVYRETLQQNGSRRDDAVARQRAVAAVKERFARDGFGRWREKEREAGDVITGAAR